MHQLTLFTSPRACSTACHIALEESGLRYDLEVVKIREGQHHLDDYIRINPWGKIPALKVGKEVLTEAHAILSLTGDLAPADRNLMPQNNPLARARAHEWMNFLTSTVHIAFRPLFRPHFFVSDKSLYPKLREVAIPSLKKTLLEVDRRLENRHWALGDHFSVVDPYILVFWIWCQRDDVVGYVADMPNWKAHAQRIFEREATWTCLQREGVTPDNLSNP